MSHADDFKQGLINRRRILGDAWVDRALAGANGFNAEFQSLITRHVWHDIWGRPGLPDKTRRLMVMSMMVALGRFDEFAMHARAALAANDVSVDELKELLLQTATYCGVPAANSAFHAAQAVLLELGREPPAGVAPELHFELEGPQQAPLFVLAHALGCDLHMWDDVAERLLDAGFAVLRYDARGHGRSPTLPGPFDIHRMADDAERLVARHVAAQRSVLFVGLSMGGMVAQALAARRPTWLSRVVIANSASSYDDAAQAMWQQRIATVQSQGLAAIADGAMQRWFTPEFRQGEPARVQRLRDTLCACDPRGYVEACRAVAGIDLLAGLAQATCPALVIAGSRDEATPPALSRAMVELLPDGRYAELPCAHLSAVEDPQAFAELLLGFARG